MGKVAKALHHLHFASTWWTVITVCTLLIVTVIHDMESVVLFTNKINVCLYVDSTYSALIHTAICQIVSKQFALCVFPIAHRIPIMKL